MGRGIPLPIFLLGGDYILINVTLNEPEIKNELRKIILNLRNRTGQYYTQIQKIKKYFMKTKNSELASYHASSFSFLKEKGYYSLKTNITSRQLLNLYKNFSNLFEEIQQQITKSENKSQLEYIIYYEDSSGVLHRIKLDKIVYKDVRKSSSALRLKQSQLKKYVDNLTQSEYLTSHYNTFVGALQATYNASKDGQLPNKIINRGYLIEAFQRHLQNVHGGVIKSEVTNQPPYNLTQIWKDVSESKGNVAWYQEGDVGNLQVKNVTSGDVRLATYDSFEDLINFLDYLLNPNEDLDKQVDNAYKIFIAQITDPNIINNRIKKYVKQDVYNQIQQSMKT